MLGGLSQQMSLAQTVWAEDRCGSHFVSITIQKAEKVQLWELAPAIYRSCQWIPQDHQLVNYGVTDTLYLLEYGYIVSASHLVQIPLSGSQSARSAFSRSFFHKLLRILRKNEPK